MKNYQEIEHTALFDISSLSVRVYKKSLEEHSLRMVPQRSCVLDRILNLVLSKILEA
jgi:hypothetical protein